MPRGFLVKRTKKQHELTSSPSSKPDSEDTDGVDYDVPLHLTTQLYTHCPYGSPDSGFSQSPVNLTTGHRSSSPAGRTLPVVQEEPVRSPAGGSSPGSTSPGSSLPGSSPRQSVGSPATDPGICMIQDKPDLSPNSWSAPDGKHTAKTTAISNNNNHRSSSTTINSKPADSIFSKPPPSHPSNFKLSPHAVPNPLSYPFYFSAFDRLSVTSPKAAAGFPRGAPPAFLPPPGLFPPGYPALTLPRRVPTSAPSSPPDLLSPNNNNNKRKAPDSAPKKSAKKPKAARKIQFDEDKSSPVSGTIIRDPSDVDDDSGIRVVSGDIDSSLNYVEVTPEAREELAKIENKIGAYACQLCKEVYEDAFQLAQHRCSRIIHVEYRCPECDKVFNCPANLASHRRWHKPRGNNNNNNNTNGPSENRNKTALKSDAKRALDAINGNIAGGPLHPALLGDGKLAKTDLLFNRGIENMLQHRQRNNPSPEESAEGQFECEVCRKKFRRQAYLRKHLASHLDEPTLPCLMCSKLFRSESAHTKHMLQAHNFLPPQTQPQPSRAAPPAPLVPQMAPLRAENACALCGQNLASKMDLEQHQRTHHPEEVYSCKYCTAVFYSSPGLTRHINKCHPSENRQVILLHMPQITPPISQITPPINSSG